MIPVKFELYTFTFLKAINVLSMIIQILIEKVEQPLRLGTEINGHLIR